MTPGNRRIRAKTLDVEDGVTHPDRVGLAKKLISAVARATGYSDMELVGERQDKRLAIARHYLLWLMSKRYGLSSTVIGKLVGDRDHTTILHGIRRHQGRVDDGSFPKHWLLRAEAVR